MTPTVLEHSDKSIVAQLFFVLSLVQKYQNYSMDPRLGAVYSMMGLTSIRWIGSKTLL